MFLVDGRPATSIPVADRGLHYGDGLFETLAIVDGTPLALDAHLRRLEHGCTALLLPAPEANLLRDECLQVAAGAARAVLKIIITRGSGGRGYLPPAAPLVTRIVSRHPWPDHPAHHRKRGIATRFCTFTLARQPALAGVKHLNRLEQVLARAELAGSDCAEGIMLDTGAAVVEGTMSNLFVRLGQRLLTPPVDQCGIAGIVRAEVLARCATLGYRGEVHALAADDVRAAEEIFFTNSIIGIWPVCRLDGHELAPALAAPALERLLADAGCIAPA